MRQENRYVAAIRIGHSANREQWQLTNDNAIIMAADEVIFAETQRELIQKLHEREKDKRNTSTVTPGIGDIVYARETTSSRVAYFGTDYAELLKIIKEQIKKYGRYYDEVYIPVEHRRYFSETYHTGLVVNGGNNSPYLAVRLRHTHVERKIKDYIRARELHPVITEMFAALKTSGFHYVPDPCGSNMIKNVYNILTGVILINHLHGRNAHRRLDAFQKLVSRWKATRNIAINTCLLKGTATEFINWMDIEAKVRKWPKPKAIADWPKIRFKMG